VTAALPKIRFRSRHSADLGLRRPQHPPNAAINGIERLAIEKL